MQRLLRPFFSMRSQIRRGTVWPILGEADKYEVIRLNKEDSHLFICAIWAIYGFPFFQIMSVGVSLNCTPESKK